MVLSQHQLHHKYCGEVLPYLEIKKQEELSEINKNVDMVNVEGMEVNEAKKVLKELNLEVEIIGEGNIVLEQLPKAGIQINEGTKVSIYT